MSRKHPVLLVEDDESDVILESRAMKLGGIANDVVPVGNGEVALDFLRHRGSFSDTAAFARPTLILLDLKMPRMGGLELLSVLQFDPKLSDIPVIILTGSDDPTDRETAFSRGASGYLVKPVTAEQIISAAEAAGAHLVVDPAAISDLV
ncbi:MAG: response regulator [bacterium]|nr:response regulator [bacterium]